MNILFSVLLASLLAQADPCVTLDGSRIRGASSYPLYDNMKSLLKDRQSKLSDKEIDLWLMSNYPRYKVPGRIEQREPDTHGYCDTKIYLPFTGVFNPATNSVKWEKADYHGYGENAIALPFSGVFNPKTGVVEWQKAEYEGYGKETMALPYTGIFNPISGKVEWKKADYEGYGTQKIALPYTGVFNPISGKVEWKKADYEGYGYKKHTLGYTGAFDPKKQDVIWKKETSSYDSSDRFSTSYNVSAQVPSLNPETREIKWESVSKKIVRIDHDGIRSEQTARQNASSSSSSYSGFTLGANGTGYRMGKFHFDMSGEVSYELTAFASGPVRTAFTSSGIRYEINLLEPSTSYQQQASAYMQMGSGSGVVPASTVFVPTGSLVICDTASNRPAPARRGRTAQPTPARVGR